MVFAAFLLAYTIATQSNRNFMRAPQWVPNAVSEDDTYGTLEHIMNPEARRLGAKDAGAICAIFDAFYERAYWGSVGPSNNWHEAADDYTGINVFKVGRNFDFFYKELVYTNDDGTVVGDTNGTGLVMTDSHRLLEYDNLKTFFTRAYNNFLNNDGVPLLERSTWETGNRRQYWSCSRMPKDETNETSIANSFVQWIWGYGRRSYEGAPPQHYSFVPLAALSHQGALWSDGNGQVEHIVHSLLKGTWTGDEIVYGDDDLETIIPTGETYEFYDRSPSDLFDNIYHLGTNGISGADITRRLMPDIYNDIEWNWFEPLKYSARTNVMWSVPSALTLAASSLDTTIEELKLIENRDDRPVIVKTYGWESVNEYRPEGMRPWEHLQLSVLIHMERDEFGSPMFLATIPEQSCPLPGHVTNYTSKSISSTNSFVNLPKNYATYRFSGMLPGDPINPRINVLDSASGSHTNEFDILDMLKTYVGRPELSGLEKVPVNVLWFDRPDVQAVELWVIFIEGPYYYDTFVNVFMYEELWLEDDQYGLRYDAFMDLKGSYSESWTLPTAKESSYYFASAPPSDRLDETTYHFAAAELFRFPIRIRFIASPFTIEVDHPVPIGYAPGSELYQFYREYCFSSADSVGDVFDVVKDRCLDNVIGTTLRWTPGFDDSMKPEDMLEGTMTFSDEKPLEVNTTCYPASGTTYYATFDEYGGLKEVYASEEAIYPMAKITGYIRLNWKTTFNTIKARAEVEQLDGRNIRPPVEIDDRAGILMKNTWKWKSCNRESF